MKFEIQEERVYTNSYYILIWATGLPLVQLAVNTQRVLYDSLYSKASECIQNQITTLLVRITIKLPYLEVCRCT